MKKQSISPQSHILGLLALITIAFLPIYFFKSGGFQPVDIIIILTLFIIAFSTTENELNIGIVTVSPFIPYAIWTTIMNGIASFSLSNYEPLLHGTGYVLYTLLILFIYTIIFLKILSLPNKNIFLIIFFFIGCLTPWLGADPSTTSRTSLSFNNPNQLGYFAILMQVMLCIASGKNILFSKNHPAISILILLALNTLVLLSQSRAAIAASSIINIYFIVFLLKNYRKHLLTFFTIILLSMPIYLNSEAAKSHSVALMNFCEKFTSRFSKKGFLDLKDLNARIFVPLKTRDDLTFVFGQGEKIVEKKEVHNSFVGTFDLYGVIGTLLFTTGFVFFIVRNKPITNNIILLSPIIIYNMSHYGLRFRLLWIALALFAAASYKKEQTTQMVTSSPQPSP